MGVMKYLAYAPSMVVMIMVKERVVPIALTTGETERIAPKSYQILQMVEGEAPELKFLGHLDEHVAVHCLEHQAELLQMKGIPFEVKLEECSVIVHKMGVIMQ